MTTIPSGIAIRLAAVALFIGVAVGVTFGNRAAPPARVVSGPSVEEFRRLRAQHAELVRQHQALVKRQQTYTAVLAHDGVSRGMYQSDLFELLGPPTIQQPPKCTWIRRGTDLLGRPKGRADQVRTLTVRFIDGVARQVVDDGPAW